MNEPIHPKTVFAKSELGRERFRDRASGLTPAQRSLLIMINGRLSVADLVRHLTAIPDVVGNVRELLQGGFIEALNDPAAGRPSSILPASTTQFGSSRALDAVRAAQRPIELDARSRRVLETELVEVLGPMGALLCEEVLTSASEFPAALDRLAAELEPAEQHRYRSRVLALLR